MVKLSTTFVKPNANRSVCVKSGKTKYSENGGLWYGVRVEKDGEVGVYEYDKRKDKPKKNSKHSVNNKTKQNKIQYNKNNKR